MSWRGRLKEPVFLSSMSYRQEVQSLICSASLALAILITASYANEIVHKGAFVARHNLSTPVRDGWYGIFDPMQPEYDPMWDPILVKQENVVYDDAFTDDYGCKDAREHQPVSDDQCFIIVRQNSYRQLNSIQIERITPSGKISVLTWYKQPD